ncbi:uncharacterized protein LOC119736901 [Patiria miniata]|uniref:Sulfotransferase family protein n=1 Tax=Patiria miniata TaxID=46514 RepID=A0A914AU64_PATMI|nr:uncharacterized protein LOC119736901 [Patiria miniata]
MANIHEQPRVILWSVPRSCTTAVLRSISNLEGGVFYNDPYNKALFWGPECESASTPAPRATAILPSAGSAYDSSIFTYAWVKKTLEAEHKDASLVFVKDFAMSLTGKVDMDHLPHGYRHTFLIRNPNKVIPSWRKCHDEWRPSKPLLDEEAKEEWHKADMGEYAGFKDLLELYQYVRENLDPAPFVMDADDLVSQPETVMTAYCKATGIPFSRKLIEWENDSSPMYAKWITCRDQLGYFNCDYHTNDRCSSGFRKNEDLPKPASTSVTNPKAIEQIAKCVPYYEKLYRERFVP